jgi:hypothetical protein
MQLLHFAAAPFAGDFLNDPSLVGNIPVGTGGSGGSIAKIAQLIGKRG